MAYDPEDLNDDIDACIQRLDTLAWAAEKPMAACLISVLEKAAQDGGRITIEYRRTGELEVLTATLEASDAP